MKVGLHICELGWRAILFTIWNLWHRFGMQLLPVLLCMRSGLSNIMIQVSQASQGVSPLGMMTRFVIISHRFGVI